MGSQINSNHMYILKCIDCSIIVSPCKSMIFINSLTAAINCGELTM